MPAECCVLVLIDLPAAEEEATIDDGAAEAFDAMEPATGSTGIAASDSYSTAKPVGGHCV